MSDSSSGSSPSVSDAPLLKESAQPRLPQIHLKRGLEGQDENLDGLMSLYEDLQLASVEAAREDNLLDFVEKAFYFAVIHKVSRVISTPDYADDIIPLPGPAVDLVEESLFSKPKKNRKKKSKRSVIPEPEQSNLKPISSSLGSEIAITRQTPAFDDLAGLRSGELQPGRTSVKSELTEEDKSGRISMRDAPAQADDPGTRIRGGSQNANELAVSYDMEDVRAESKITTTAGEPWTIPPSWAIASFRSENEDYTDSSESSAEDSAVEDQSFYDSEEEPGSMPHNQNLPRFREYLNARYDPQAGSVNTGRSLDFKPAASTSARAAARIPFGLSLPLTVPVRTIQQGRYLDPSCLPPVANVNPYIGFVYMTRNQTQAELDASGGIGSLSIGIIIRKADRGKGFARAAITNMLRYVFDKRVDCHRVQALIPQSSDKQRALNLFTQLQFGHEGTRRRSFFSFGEWKDTTCLAMLNTDWAMRTFFTPAPRTLWDEMFIRHERERDELLRWEEWRVAGNTLLQRTASMETIRDGKGSKASCQTPSQSESEAESDVVNSTTALYMKAKGKKRAADEAAAAVLGFSNSHLMAVKRACRPTDASGGLEGYRYEDFRGHYDLEEGGPATGRASPSPSVSSSSGYSSGFSSTSVVSRPPSSTVSSSRSTPDWDMMDDDDESYYHIDSGDEEEGENEMY
ncbi:hypothetical protein L218DRAFT_1075073 [Marasmius fiardii PR-910]|nr:hypothetical protein L218DRAFT_1075073 [Marasmius fiardii PR-910]